MHRDVSSFRCVCFYFSYIKSSTNRIANFKVDRHQNEQIRALWDLTNLLAKFLPTKISVCSVCVILNPRCLRFYFSKNYSYRFMRIAFTKLSHTQLYDAWMFIFS